MLLLQRKLYNKLLQYCNCSIHFSFYVHYTIRNQVGLPVHLLHHGLWKMRCLCFHEFFHYILHKSKFCHFCSIMLLVQDRTFQSSSIYYPFKQNYHHPSWLFYNLPESKAKPGFNRKPHIYAGSFLYCYRLQGKLNHNLLVSVMEHLFLYGSKLVQ